MAAPFAVQPAFAARPAAAAASSFLSSQRGLHSACARLSDGEESAEQFRARAAAMKEAFRKKKAEEEERKQREAAENPQPAEGEGEAKPAGEAEGASAAAAGEGASASSDVPPAPTQPQVNRLWSRLRDEIRYLNEHLSKKSAAAGPAKREKQRPTIAKSRIPYKEWSSDPLAEAAAANKKAKAEEEASEEAAAAAPEYTGSTALQAVDNETMWDKRMSAWKERLRYFGVAVPKKALRGAAAQSKTLAEWQERMADRLEEAKEQWEVSQDPRVWRMRDMVDRVAGETETGMAMGELMAADPSFDQLDFLRDMEEVMIPEVVSAFRTGDMRLLKSVTEGAAAAAVFASFRQRDEQKVEWDARILDVRGVDIVKASIHNDVPFIHLTFVCQHVAAEYDAKTGEIKDPLKASVVQNTYYSWAMRRDYDSPYYDWKIFEFQYQHIQALI